MKKNNNSRPSNRTTGRTATIVRPGEAKKSHKVTKEKIMKTKKSVKETKSVKATAAVKKETAKKSTKVAVNSKKFKASISRAVAEKLQQLFFAQKKGEIKREKFSAAVEKAGITQADLWKNCDHFNLINHRS